LPAESLLWFLTLMILIILKAKTAHQTFMIFKSTKLRDYILGAGIPLILTIPFYIWPADILWQQLFYENGWIFEKDFFWQLLYNHGKWPMVGVILLSIAILIYSALTKKMADYRRPALYMLVMILLSSGYIVNILLKGNFGRPRPRHIVEFGGTFQYQLPFEPGIPGSGNSFPSGHATLGFLFFGLSFVLRRFNLKASTVVFWLALFFGLTMGLGRNIQGGHFASDVIWSGGFSWLVAAVLYHQLFYRERPLTNRQKSITRIIFTVIFIQAIFFNGYYRQQEKRLAKVRTEKLSSALVPVVTTVDSALVRGDVIINYKIHGFGMAGAKPVIAITDTAIVLRTTMPVYSAQGYCEIAVAP
jgi:lipid A 4'-phosphatase